MVGANLKIWVEYFREYFEINDVRVTYDSDTKFLDVTNWYFKVDTNIL